LSAGAGLGFWWRRRKRGKRDRAPDLKRGRRSTAVRFFSCPLDVCFQRFYFYFWKWVRSN
jgi:hypothetical protein